MQPGNGFRANEGKELAVSMATDLTTRCSRTGAQALRHGLQLAADPLGAYRAVSLLLRGSLSLVGWLVGWLSAEFPPHVLTGNALSRAAPLCVGRVGTSWAAQRADRILAEALEGSFGSDYRDMVCHPIIDPSGCVRHGGLPPTTGHRRRYVTRTSNVAYGPGGRDHLLDIWRHPDLPDGGRAPVLVQVPGGAWTIADKRGQAYPLMSRMVELGWVCVPVNYRKSPRNVWPAHIVDVKRANDPRFQPGFERSDTTVQAAAPYYGVYDLTKVENMHEMMLPFLESFVMQIGYADHPEPFESASPVSHVHAGAPPFFVLHGENDSVIPRVQAQDFCVALRGAGAASVCYAELPNAHHAFDVVATVRSLLAADAVADFLGVAYGRYLRTQDGLSHGDSANPAG